MWTDRRTDMTKLTVAFRNFAHAPKHMTEGSGRQWLTAVARN